MHRRNKILKSNKKVSKIKFNNIQDQMKIQKKTRLIDKPLFTSVNNSKLNNKKTKINPSKTGNPNILKTV